MTVNSTIRKAGPYLGNGTTSVFPFSFKVFANSDVTVVRTDQLGVESKLVMGTDYSVSLNADQNSNPGGNITMLTGAPTTGYLITLTSSMAYTQTLDLTNLGGFYPKTINDALDRQAIQIQQLAEQASRSVKTDISSSVTPDQLISTLTTNANNAVAAAVSASASASTATTKAAEASASAAAALTSAATGAQVFQAEVSIASASITAIGAASSMNILITGTTTITAFDTVAAGIHRNVRFSGALVLTNSAALVLPSGANITTAANDCMEVESLGSGNWIVRGYQKASGAPLALANNSITAAMIQAGAIAGNLGYTPSKGIQSTGQQVVSTTSTLTSSALGANVLATAGGITITLPQTAANGSAICISNGATTPVTLAYTGGSDGPTSLPVGCSAMFISDGGSPSSYWRCYFNTANAIGANQTWRDVTGSRALGTTYTNSTGKTIQVSAWMTVSGSPAGNTDIQLTIGGVVVANASMYFNTAAGNRIPFVTGLVPNGTTYSAIAPTGAGTLSWVELR